MGETKIKAILSWNILQILKAAKRPRVRTRKFDLKKYFFFKGTK